MRWSRGVTVFVSSTSLRAMSFTGWQSFSQSTISTRYCGYVMPSSVSIGVYACVMSLDAV